MPKSSPASPALKLKGLILRETRPLKPPILPPNPVVIFGGGATWSGTAPVEFHVLMPPDPAYQGTTLTCQGLFADLAGAAPGEPFRLTGGLSLLVGS